MEAPASTADDAVSRAPLVPDAVFVQVWQEATSAAEVASRLGYAAQAVYPRARDLRAKGFVLKHFREPRRAPRAFDYAPRRTLAEARDHKVSVYLDEGDTIALRMLADNAGVSPGRLAFLFLHDAIAAAELLYARNHRRSA